MLNRSPVNVFLAAKNISRAYELRREYKKGLFYARIAHSRAETLERPEWTAAAVNQIGNCQLGDSMFGDAARSYRDALELVPSEDTSRAMIYQANLGYCEAVLGRARHGLHILYQCLRAARREGWRRLEMTPASTLLHAPRAGRLRDGAPGRCGLRSREASGEQTAEERAYLLGEWRSAAPPTKDACALASAQRRPNQPFLSTSWSASTRA